MNKEPTPSNNANTNWKSLENVPFAGNYQPENPDSQTIFFENRDKKRAYAPLQDEVEKVKRLNLQGSQIINAFHSGAAITEVDNSTTDAARTDFYNWINNHQLTSTEESHFLQTLTPPMLSENGSPEQTLRELSSDHEHGILAFISGRGLKKRDSVNTSDLQIILSRYPTPVEFQSAETNFLNALAQPQKRIEYAKDLEIFKQKFYGELQEYHEAWQKLEQEAKAYQDSLNRQPETPEEYAGKVKEGVYAEYFYPSEDLGYLPPEVQAQYRNPDHQPANETSSSNVSPKTEPKKGLFGKFFGRKK